MAKESVQNTVDVNLDCSTESENSSGVNAFVTDPLVSAVDSSCRDIGRWFGKGGPWHLDLNRTH